jgi:hypothetical protein
MVAKVAHRAAAKRISLVHGSSESRRGADLAPEHGGVCAALVELNREVDFVAHNASLRRRRIRVRRIRHVTRHVARSPFVPDAIHAAIAKLGEMQHAAAVAHEPILPRGARLALAYTRVLLPTSPEPGLALTTPRSMCHSVRRSSVGTSSMSSNSMLCRGILSNSIGA